MIKLYFSKLGNVIWKRKKFQFRWSILFAYQSVIFFLWTYFKSKLVERLHFSLNTFYYATFSNWNVENCKIATVSGHWEILIFYLSCLLLHQQWITVSSVPYFSSFLLKQKMQFKLNFQFPIEPFLAATVENVVFFPFKKVPDKQLKPSKKQIAH